MSIVKRLLEFIGWSAVKNTARPIPKPKKKPHTKPFKSYQRP